jgi:hypothetical protein
MSTAMQVMLIISLTSAAMGFLIGAHKGVGPLGAALGATLGWIGLIVIALYRPKTDCTPPFADSIVTERPVVPRRRAG